jgi:acetylornithine deacetylase
MFLTELFLSDFVKDRSNLIIKYPGTTDQVCSFVGSHLDVVPADPSTWERNPFQLTVEDNILHGRGTTDCLGHGTQSTIIYSKKYSTRAFYPSF